MRKLLHVATLHNNPGITNVERMHNERNRQWCLEDGNRLGDQLLVLCLDASTNVAKPIAMQDILGSIEARWYDAAQLYQRERGLEPTHNTKGGTDASLRDRA